MRQLLTTKEKDPPTSWPNVDSKTNRIIKIINKLIYPIMKTFIALLALASGSANAFAPVNNNGVRVNSGKLENQKNGNVWESFGEKTNSNNNDTYSHMIYDTHLLCWPLFSSFFLCSIKHLMLKMFLLQMEQCLSTVYAENGVVNTLETNLVRSIKSSFKTFIIHKYKQNIPRHSPISWHICI